MVDDEDILKGAETVITTEEKEDEITTEDGSDEQEPEEGAEEEAGEETPEDSENGEEDLAEELEQPAKPVGRAQARIQKLAAEKDAERAEKDRAINERAVAVAELNLLKEQQRQSQTASQQRAEEERMALLAPEERAMVQANTRIQNLEYQINQMEMRRMDDQDHANFHAKAAHDPVYKKYAPDIEASYQDGLKRGVRAPREELLAWKLGKELLNNRQTAAPKKKEAAGKRIEQVTSKPIGARGGVAGAKTSKTEEDRLRGVLI